MFLFKKIVIFNIYLSLLFASSSEAQVEDHFHYGQCAQWLMRNRDLGRIDIHQNYEGPFGDLGVSWGQAFKGVLGFFGYTPKEDDRKIPRPIQYRGQNVKGVVAVWDENLQSWRYQNSLGRIIDSSEIVLSVLPGIGDMSSRRRHCKHHVF